MTRRLAQLHRRRAELAEQLAAVDRAIAAEHDEAAGVSKPKRRALPQPTAESRARMRAHLLRAGVELPEER